MSPSHPRTTLVARSRQHFAALAATGIVMTGALAACAHLDDQATATTTGSTTTSSGTGSSTGWSTGSSTGSSSSGLTSGNQSSSGSDGTSSGS